MKGVIRTAVLCIAFGALMAAQTAHAAADNKAMKGTATIGYWVGNYSGSSSAMGEKAYQRFLPVIGATMKYKDNYYFAAEFATAKDTEITEQGTMVDPLYTIKTDKLLFGVRYMIPDKPDMYASLSYRSNEFTWNDRNTPAYSVSAKVQGFRLGIGGKEKLEGQPITLSGDLGYGIMTKTNISLSNGLSLTPKTSTVDYELRATYSMRKYKFRPQVGYRYENNKINSDVVSGITLPEMSLKLRGYFIGAEMDF